MNNVFVLFWIQESASMTYWCKHLCWGAARLNQKPSSLNDTHSGKDRRSATSRSPWLCSSAPPPDSAVGKVNCGGAQGRDHPLRHLGLWWSDKRRALPAAAGPQRGWGLPTGVKAVPAWGQRDPLRPLPASATHSPGRGPLQSAWNQAWRAAAGGRPGQISVPSDAMGTAGCGDLRAKRRTLRNSPWAALHLPHKKSPALPPQNLVKPSGKPFPPPPPPQQPDCRAALPA